MDALWLLLIPGIFISGFGLMFLLDILSDGAAFDSYEYFKGDL